MLLKVGDTISFKRLNDVLSQSRSLVYNLNLFSEVKIVPVLCEDVDLQLNVNVRERWYLYPIPQFQLTDRNFNEWIKVYHANFDRVIYGAKLIQYNLSGRGDQLKIYLLNGFTRGITFSYSTPYSNPSLTEGFHINAGFTQSHGVAYRTTSNNKLNWYKKDGFVRNDSRVGLGYSRKRGYYKRTSYAISYQYININDSLVTTAYNPGYFNSSKPHQSVVDFSFIYQYSKTDNINYPLIGKNYSLGISKRGFKWKGTTNMLSLGANFNLFTPFIKSAGIYQSVQLLGRLKLPFEQAYINRRNFGYGDVNLRGLEYYVIDGVAGLLANYTLRKKIFEFRINVPFHIRQVPYIPFKFYGKTYADAGYSYLNAPYVANLNNRFLYSYGFGLDILSLYDVNVSFEYSFNQLGENGLFLHLKGGF